LLLDLTQSNVLFELQDIQSWSTAQIYEHLGSPKTASVKLLDGSYSQHAPRKVVQAADFSNIGVGQLGNIRITDFGQSFFVENPPNSVGIPMSFRAPEMSFGFPPSKNSDIWALACLIFQIQSSAWLFPVIFDNTYAILGTIVDVLGPFPSEWERSFSLIEHGTPSWWFQDSFKPGRSIASLVTDNCKHLSPTQQETFLELLRGMLAYEPIQRLSADNVARNLLFLECSEEGSRSPPLK
jgi:serine/threonine-protein kinase SRPK3